MSRARSVIGARVRPLWPLRFARRQADTGAAIWLLPVMAIGLIYFSPKHVVLVNTAVTGLIALAVIAVAARWPDRSLMALIIVLPFQGLILAKLWNWGVPTSIVRHVGAWKEALALGVVVAGVRNFLGTGRRADALDRLGLGFVVIALLYVALQHTIIPSAPSSSSIRLLGFREDAAFVLLLLGARHAPLPANFLDRAGRAVFIVAAVVAGIAIFEALDSSGWNTFVTRTIRYTLYQSGVLHSQPLNFYDIRVYGTIGGTSIVRVGSVFLNPLTLGFYLVLGFAVGLERTIRGQARLWAVASLLIIVAALLLTQTRSAIVAALVALFLALRPAAGRRASWRTQLGIVIAAIAVVAIPTAVATGLTQRVSTTRSADNSGHVASFWDGVNSIEHHPLGQGLGTSAGIGQRFQSQVSQVVVPENNYLQIGVELGVIPMLVFAALTIALIVKARVAARGDPHYLLAAAAGAVAGLAVGAWLLQTWSDFTVAWTVWGLAGAALGASSARAREAARAGRRASASPEIRGGVETAPA